MSKGYGKPKVGGPFTLRDLEGKEFTEKDLLGKYTLVCGFGPWLSRSVSAVPLCLVGLVHVTSISSSCHLTDLLRLLPLSGHLPRRA